MIGMGVLINSILGRPGVDPCPYYGKTIIDLVLDENENCIFLTLDDCSKFKIWDGGQSCCENRYMRTDDDLSSLVGQKLMRLEVKEAANEPDKYGEHEVCFLEIGTDQSFVTIANHNEHNGYYGGFFMCFDKIEG